MDSLVYRVIKELMLPFFTAFGVITGGCIVGALSSLFTDGSPLATMNDLAKSIKIWAVMVGIGGTFNVIRGIEYGLFEGDITALLRQMLVFFSSFSGAYLGYWVIISLSGGE